MSKQLKDIQDLLTAAAEKSNRDFFQKMVPGKQKIYGVKTPALNDLAKKIKEGSFDLAEDFGIRVHSKKKSLRLRSLNEPVKPTLKGSWNYSNNSQKLLITGPCAMGWACNF